MRAQEKEVAELRQELSVVRAKGRETYDLLKDTVLCLGALYDRVGVLDGKGLKKGHPGNPIDVEDDEDKVEVVEKVGEGSGTTRKSPEEKGKGREVVEDEGGRSGEGSSETGKTVVVKVEEEEIELSW